MIPPERFDPASVQGTYVISATDYAVAQALGLRLIVRQFESDGVAFLLSRILPHPLQQEAFPSES